MSGDKPLRWSRRLAPSEMETFEFSNCMGLVHKADGCDPDYPCTIHRPSDHNKREWPMLLRRTGLVERTCTHGVGHPDPDSAAWMNRSLEHEAGTWETHGCDSCCWETDA